MADHILAEHILVAPADSCFKIADSVRTAADSNYRTVRWVGSCRVVGSTIIVAHNTVDIGWGRMTSLSFNQN